MHFNLTDIKKLIAQGRAANAIEELTVWLATEEVFNVEAHYLLAVSYRLRSSLSQAIDCNHLILKHAPENARVWQELGHCYKTLNQPQEAANHFYKAVQFNPALLASWQYLKSFYQQTGNSKALELASKQVNWLSTLPKPVLGAKDLFNEGDIDKADTVCRQFLNQHKHHPDAMLLLAEIGIKRKAYSESEFLLESCVTLHPDHYYSGLEYGRLLNQMGKYQQALTVCESLLTNQPADKSLLVIKAGALLGIGDTQKSVDIYRILLQQDSEQPFIWLLLGHALKAQGEYQQAISAYHKAADIKPDLGDAWWSLANTKTYQFSRDEITQMTALSANQSTTTEDKIHLNFALGKAHEHNKEVDLSFACYQRGNEHKQRLLNYDITLLEKQVDNQIAYFNAPLFESLPEVGCTDPAPIFIVGLPRAGSTLLEQILASHSQVEGTMELHNILSLVSRLKKDGVYPTKLGELEPDYFRRFGEQFITDTLIYRSGAAYFIDKMPNNFLHIGLIRLILPNAKIIDARRNPMDCCFSGYKQLFGEGQEFSYSLEHIARYYKAYEKLMSHWHTVLPGFVLHVQHEDVIEDLETQVRSMLDFCQLPFETSCLEFYNTKRSIKTPSSEQVRQPVNRKGLHQWKPFEEHLNVLKGYFPD